MKNHLFAIFAFFAAAVSARTTLFDIIEGEDSLSTLQTALELTDLDDVLDCGRYSCHYLTAFAPTNDAFAALGETLTLLTENAEYITHLRNTLLYHVIYRRLFSRNIRDGGSRRTIQGERIHTSIDDNGDIFINQAKVIEADIHAYNGLAHVIDSVLIPSFLVDNIITVAEKAGVFGTLLVALEEADLTETLKVIHTKRQPVDPQTLMWMKGAFFVIVLVFIFAH